MDVDTGIDDALALVYLLSRPEVRIQAITCTAGNVGARQVALNNLALLELCGRAGIEVAIGAEVPLEIPLVTTEETHGPQGIGYAELPAAGAADLAAARRRRLGGGGPRASGGNHRADHRSADQLRPGAARGTGAAAAAQGPGHHGRLLQLPGQHDADGGMERLGGSARRQGGLRGLPRAARRTSCRWSARWRPRSGSRCARSTCGAGEAAGARDPNWCCPEQPEGQRSTLGQPAGGLPLRRHPLLHGVPPALRPGLRGAHARRLRGLRWRRDARRSPPGWPRSTSKRTRRCWSAPRWPITAGSGG